MGNEKVWWLYAVLMTVYQYLLLLSMALQLLVEPLPSIFLYPGQMSSNLALLTSVNFF